MEGVIVKGYREIGFPELQEELNKLFKESKKSHVELAYEMGVKSISTISNILSGQPQVVSDENLTKFINLFGLQAFVQWKDGIKKYYIKN